MVEKMNIDPEFRRKFNKQRCPICSSIEGCDHTMWERLRALTDLEYRDQMRRDDPLSK